MIPAGEHPAAPEGETKASGLTEDEKAPLRNTIRDAIGRPYGFDAICRQVERIVAERLRVVEGERDALRQQVLDEWATLVRRTTTATARAESAEAAYAALVAVLHEHFDFDVDPWEDHEAACPAPEDLWRLHRDLRTLLAGDNQ